MRISGLQVAHGHGAVNGGFDFALGIPLCQFGHHGGVGLGFEGLAANSTTLKPRALMRGDCREAPLYGLMVAAGMSLRTSV